MPGSDLERLFREIGKILLSMGLVDSHSGNMSTFSEGKVYITRTKSMLGRLRKGDIVEFSLGEDQIKVPESASQEALVHAEIYRRIGCGAIIHAHPPCAVSLSLIISENRISPIDYEGRLLLREVPILEADPNIKKEDLGKDIANHLKSSRIVLIKGHGSFSAGENLEEALMYTSCLEQSCFILLNRLLFVGRRG